MKRTSIYRFTALLAVCFVVVVFSLFTLQAVFNETIRSKGAFLQQELTINSNNLFDIGVVDYDADGLLDVFTTNHHSRQSLLIADGQRGFAEVIGDTGFDQDPDFPNSEIAKYPPLTDKEGLYIYRTNRGLIFDLQAGDTVASARGTVSFLSSLPIRAFGSQPVKISQDPFGNGLYAIEVAFQVEQSGNFGVSAPLIAIPFEVKLDETIPLESIFVGQDLVSPSEHSFTLELNDRHAMAWADYDGDGDLDVFVTRGGIRNFMEYFPAEYHDELYEKQGNRHVNVITASGIEKQACPGYNAQWVDFDGDGDLDLYMVCHHDHPNKLYEQVGGQRFVEVAESYGLAFTGSSTDTPMVWVDILNDGAQELVIFQDSQLQIYQRRATGYERYWGLERDGITKIACVDVDNDGDLDIFVSSYSGDNALVLNEDKKFVPVDLAATGLPAGALYAQWVDYDNDGLVDLYLLPHGLFKQTGRYRFEATGLLKPLFSWNLRRARATWFDRDNDGFRDLLLASFFSDPLWKGIMGKVFGHRVPSWAASKGLYDEWGVHVFHNQGERQYPENGWLQLRINGPRDNRQSIGATVTVVTESNKKTAAFVGQSDGSAFSQGHYRLYYGLGGSDTVRSIAVAWPDGTTTEVAGTFRNQVLDVGPP